MKTTKFPSLRFGLFLSLLMGGILLFFAAAEDYYVYAAGTIEHACAQPILNKEDVKSLAAVPLAYDTEIKYRKFYLTAPGATQVELRGDFNRWGKDPVFLTPYKKGYFETSVALASGEYKYVFVVDGKEWLDPTNQDHQTLEDGRDVCIKTVR